MSLVLVMTGAMPKIPNSIIQRGERSKSHPIENDSLLFLGDAANPAIIPPNKDVINAGGDILVAGSEVFQSNNPIKTIQTMYEK